MSTFCGIIEEIPFISVDRFYGKNLKSKLFFLSHCHSDHMKGLYDCEELPGPLYASPASVVLIKKQFPLLKSTIIALETECPQEIEYEADNHKYTIMVTSLSARHCPGSVMFLFQTKTCNILYTGDFRITQNDLEKNFKILEDISIDVVYLDSTFLNKNYQEFPSQIDSINTILKIISEWLNINKNNQIFLEIPAQYGTEYLFIEIYRKLKQKIYIEKEQQNKYIYFSDMDKCISQNQNECRIHVIKSEKIGEFDNRYKRIIRISALIWKNWKKGDKIFTNNYNYYRVLCSSHSSLMEIKDFLNFIKPKSIKLNVIPSNENEKQKMYKTLNEIYPLNNVENEECSSEQVEKINDFTNIHVISSFNNENLSPPPTKKRILPKRIKS